MAQTVTAREVAEEGWTWANRFFVRTAKAASCRKYAPEEMIRIVFGEVPEGGHREPVSGLQRSAPIAPPN